MAYEIREAEGGLFTVMSDEFVYQTGIMGREVAEAVITAAKLNDQICELIETNFNSAVKNVAKRFGLEESEAKARIKEYVKYL